MARETIINTYDPADFIVTIHPLPASVENDDNAITRGLVDITEFAPGTPFTASVNKDKIVAHKGVNGEILRTFLNNRRGTVTMNLLSSGGQAKGLIEMFSNIHRQDYVRSFNKSPISSIRVSRKTKDGQRLILTATDCWLTKDPTWQLTSDVFYATLVFDCTRMSIKHG